MINLNFKRSSGSYAIQFSKLIFLFFVSTFSHPNKFALGVDLTAYVTSISQEEDVATRRQIKYLTYLTNQNAEYKSKSKNSMSIVFSGSRYDSIGIVLQFMKTKDKTDFHKFQMTEKEVKRTQKMIDRNYYYRFNVDGIIVTCPIGKKIGSSYHIFTELDFNLLYNDESIVYVQIVGERPQEVKTGYTYDMSYKQTWKKTQDSAEDRLEKTFDVKFFQNPLRKYSLISASIECILVIILVLIIIKQMITDMMKPNTMNDFDDFDLQSTCDRGWKMLHGDVFRNPKHTVLLSILGGSSFQISIVVVLSTLILSLQPIDNHREYYLILALILYILCSILCGIVSVAYSNSFGERKWLRIALASVNLCPFILIYYYMIVSFLGKSSSSVYNVSFFSLIVAVILSIFPMIFSTIGGWIAKKKQIFETIPCDVALVPRMTPKLPWYLQTWVLCIFTGFFCSTAILSELYFLLTALWKGKFYYVFKYLYASIVLLVILSACMSLIIVYFRLQNESYSWHWISFLAPFSSSAFVFVYCLIFHSFKLNTTGLFAHVFYYIVSIMISLLVGFVAGSSGYLSSNIFVRSIFSNLKID